MKHFCSFLNYNKLKYKLDAIPEDKDVVVDFSMCEFVDHTVMENLHDYQELFLKKGGHFEVVGLDMHDTDSAHPFALRRLLPVPNIFKGNLTKRQTSLESLAKEYNLEYTSTKRKETHFLDDFMFFKTKKINHIYNQITSDNEDLLIFDIEFSEGEFIAKEVVRSTMLHIDLHKSIPQFTLDREGFLEKVYAFAGYKDIPFESYSDFSKRFFLLGDDEEAIKSFFTTELIQFFESNPYYHVESNGNNLLVFSKERLASIKEAKTLLSFGKRLRDVIGLVSSENPKIS